jgi:hypothetical protein
MNKFFLFLVALTFLFSCSESSDILVNSEKGRFDETEPFSRLNFVDEQSLQEAIETGNDVLTRSFEGKRFVSLMSEKPMTKNEEGESITYYEALGYDSIVPNPNFAKLLTPDGELEVGADIIKITPAGTYKFPRECYNEFLQLMDENPNYQGQQIGDKLYQLSENVLLYKTFEKSYDDYEIISEGNYELLPDDFFEDSDESIQTKAAIPEPDFNSFQIFSADKKTVVGKLIQSLIGATKESTVKFSSSRRIGGSFYFYNYGVYAEIGVQGWTDKKNWIGWSKTATEELRVGWKDVVIKKTLDDNYSKSLNDLNNILYFPPQYSIVNGERTNIATLAMPDFKATLKDKVLKEGVKAVHNYLKNELKRPATEWEKAQAFVIASRTELYFISGTQHKVIYNTKSYTHVFESSWMEFSIDYSNKNGIGINGAINQNNFDKIPTYLNAIGKAFKDNKASLISGEVYTCARFDNNWRGLKIVKK